MGRLNTIQGFAGITSIVNQQIEPEYIGATMVFAQTVAPSGWVKQTSYNDYALRIVSGTGGGAVSSNQSFTTVFTTDTEMFSPETGTWPLGATQPTTLVTLQMQSHTHTGHAPHALGLPGYTTGWPGSGPGSAYTGYVSSTAVPLAYGGLTGGGGGHSHASGTVTDIAYSSPFNFNIKYKDVILAKYH